MCGADGAATMRKKQDEGHNWFLKSFKSLSFLALGTGIINDGR